MNLSLLDIRKCVFRSFLIWLIFQLCLQSVKAQTFEWAMRNAGMTHSYPNSGSRWVCTDRGGNVYMTGLFFGPQDFDPGTGTALLTPINADYVGMYLAKYDAAGNYIWAKSIAAGEAIQSYDVVVDKDDRVTVAGSWVYNTNERCYYQTATGIDSVIQDSIVTKPVFLMQYNSDGRFLWIKLPKGLTKNADASPIGGLSVDGEGNIYMGGCFNDSVDFDPGSGIAVITANSAGSPESSGFIAKYDASGNCLWVHGLGGDGSIQDAYFAQVMGVAIDTQGYVYLTGQFFGSIDFDPGQNVSSLKSDSTSGQGDIFLLKLDKQGHYQWAKRMGGSGIDAPSFGISIGGLGSIYISGLTFSYDLDHDPGPDTAILSRAGFNDLFLARYDSDGNFRWAKCIGGPGAGFIGTGSLIADKWDNVHLGACFLGAIDLDPGPDTAIVSAHLGLTESFLSTYDICGNYTKGGFLIGSGAGDNWLRGINVQYTEGDTLSVYVLGTFTDATDFDFGTDSFVLRPENTTDAYLLKVNFSNTPDLVNELSVSDCGEQFVFNGITYTGSGTYLQLIPLEGGCDSIILLNLTLSTIEEPFINVNEFVLGVTASYTSYQWMKDGKFIEGATEATYTVTENANYQVVVDNGMGCRDTSEVYPVTNYTSINSVEGREHLSLYPNPSEHMVYIKADQPLDVKLTDIRGRVVQEERAVQAFSVKELAEGIYLLHILDSQGRLLKVEKLVKVR